VLLTTGCSSRDKDDASRTSEARTAVPDYPGFDSLKNTEGVDLGDGSHFMPVDHGKLATRLTTMGRRCSDILAKAQWQQDLEMFFESKAHFDNCDFNSGMVYLEALLAEADREAPRHPDKAVVALGRALHGIQDFYSHTDYVERMARAEPSFRNVAMVRLWSASGRATLQQLIASGLVSGRVSWEGTRDNCGPGATEHDALNKDKPDSPRGREFIDAWAMSHYRAAYDLAARDSAELVHDRLRRDDWKQVREYCGLVLGYAVLVESRR
jgi:hypothetical protein